MRQAYEAGLPLARIHDGVLRPALCDIGRRWEAGHLAVSREHEVVHWWGATPVHVLASQ